MKMESAGHGRYKNMLIEVADVVDQETSVLESMKFICDKIIKGRERDQIKSAIQLWTSLEKREYLGPSNTNFLKELLKSCFREKTEALKIVERYEQDNGGVTKTASKSAQPLQSQIVYIQGLPRQHQERTVLGPDLKTEIAYLTKSLGKNWTFFMRQLDIPESEIEVIKSDYRYTKEQIHQCFLLWQDIQKEQATKERLIFALRAEKRNDLAEILTEGAYC